MWRRVASLVFPLVMCLASAARAGAQGPAHPPVNDMVPRIEGFVRRAFETGATPALGVAVVVDGRTVYERALGQADASAGISATPQTLWYVASTSKSFTGFGVALLEHQRALDLSAPITRVLPDARWHPDANVSDLSLISFLTHTHGLDGTGPVVISAAFTGAFPESRFGELTAYHAPLGSRDLRYSNFGYNVAAMAIAARRPEGWKAFLRDQVYVPAGMRATFATVSDVPAERIAKPHSFEADGRFVTQPFRKRDITMNAAGGHLATLADLARWITVHMDEGMLDGRRVFPAAAVRRSHENLGRQDARFAFFQRDGWGMGWDIGSYEGDPMVSRFGSYATMRSHISFLSARRVGVVAQVNGAPGWALTDVIAAYVYDVAAGRADADARGQARLAQVEQRLEQGKQARAQETATRAGRQRPLPRPLSDYTGDFEHPAYGRMSWRVVRDTLRVTWGVLEGPAEVFNADSSQLRVEIRGSGDVVRFGFSGSGPATEVRLGPVVLRRAPR